MNSEDANTSNCCRLISGDWVSRYKLVQVIGCPYPWARFNRSKWISLIQLLPLNLGILQSSSSTIYIKVDSVRVLTGTNFDKAG